MQNIIIVNDKDEVIGAKPRNERNRATDIGRITGLIVLNSNNETLIAQRVFSKISDPGKWGPAVGGTVEEGETYISNILKEAKEEINLDIKESDLKIESHSYRETSHKYFLTMFSCIEDKSINEFTIQKEEVEAIRWIGIKELVEWHERSPEDFIPSFQKTIDILKQK